MRCKSETRRRGLASVSKNVPGLWLPAEKQIFDQGGGGEHQDDDDKKPEQAHAPHHSAAHHLIHHGAMLISRLARLERVSADAPAPSASRRPVRRLPGSRSG